MGQGMELKVDRTGWSAGPWDSEPDRDEWRHRGFACLIVRNRSGALCGYVGVPPGHPWHGKDYDAVDVECHGGLTYGNYCQEGGSICHVARPGEPENVYWLGFDCNHGGDVAPGTQFRYAKEGLSFSEPYARYRNMDYVRNEVAALAEQAADAA